MGSHVTSCPRAAACVRPEETERKRQLDHRPKAEKEAVIKFISRLECLKTPAGNIIRSHSNRQGQQGRREREREREREKVKERERERERAREP